MDNNVNFYTHHSFVCLTIPYTSPQVMWRIVIRTLYCNMCLICKLMIAPRKHFFKNVWNSDFVIISEACVSEHPLEHHAWMFPLYYMNSDRISRHFNHTLARGLPVNSTIPVVCRWSGRPEDIESRSWKITS